jgi:DNA-binding beta-propeller fold protein YncE
VLEATGPGGTVPTDYRVYVANESSDIVSRVVFRPGAGARVEREVSVGTMPTDNDGAHGITVSPDGMHWYVTLAHGTPNGYVWKFHAGPDTLVGRTTLGRFPATMGVSPDGQFLLAANFNLHGDMVPSEVSVVYTPEMLELARVTTCLMPHGSRVDASGWRQYSTCMHSDQLVEIDLNTFEISARFGLSPLREGPLRLGDLGHHRGPGSVRDVEEPARSTGRTPSAEQGAAVCSPTWAEPGQGRFSGYVYVACNKNAEILEVDAGRWRVTRRFPTGSGPYNLEITDDGNLLIATLKGEQAIAVVDLAQGDEIARLSTTESVTHGVVVSPDSRYAFVTNEAVGATPGTLDVFDLHRLDRAASVPLRHQPGGIGFWKLTSAVSPAGGSTR